MQSGLEGVEYPVRAGDLDQSSIGLVFRSSRRGTTIIGTVAAIKTTHTEVVVYIYGISSEAGIRELSFNPDEQLYFLCRGATTRRRRTALGLPHDTAGQPLPGRPHAS